MNDHSNVRALPGDVTAKADAILASLRTNPDLLAVERVRCVQCEHVEMVDAAAVNRWYETHHCKVERT